MSIFQLYLLLRSPITFPLYIFCPMLIISHPKVWNRLQMVPQTLVLTLYKSNFHADTQATFLKDKSVHGSHVYKHASPPPVGKTAPILIQQNIPSLIWVPCTCQYFSKISSHTIYSSSNILRSIYNKLLRISWTWHFNRLPDFNPWYIYIYIFPKCPSHWWSFGEQHILKRVAHSFHCIELAMSQ